MKIDQVMKEIKSEGLKITKEKLVELIRKTPDRDFLIKQDPASGYCLVRIKWN